MTDNNTSIFATVDKSVDIGCRVVKWDEPSGFDFHRTNSYIKRDLSFDQLSAKMKQFTVHWSVCYRAAHMVNGLNQRNLSVNFMIDDDDINGFATIYQCLPIVLGAYSQGGVFNSLGPGVEISYMPQAWDNSNLYNEANRKKYNVPEHEIAYKQAIHGSKLDVFLPTKAQVNSLIQLLWGYVELFPHIPAKFPRKADGSFVTTKLDKPENYTGLVSHYHLTKDKVDTTGLDYQYIEDEIEKRKIVGY